MSSIPATSHAIVLHGTGGVENLKYEPVPTPKIGPSAVLIKNDYAGVNFIDAYFRKGIYKAELPLVLGREGAGTVVEAGAEVKDLKVGDKVAYCAGKSYSEYVVVDTKTDAFGKLPADVKDTIQYAGGMLQGLTAWGQVKYSYPVQKGDYVVVHAAAGGTGGVLVQFAKEAGAIVIGTTSSAEKVDQVKANGADFVINSKTEDVAKIVSEITNGAGVAAVYDGVGAATWDLSLELLGINGTLVSFGNASGVVPPVNILSLSPKCIKIVRPTMFNYLKLPGALESAPKEVIRLIHEKKLKIHIGKEYPLSEYPQAITDLESGKTVGKLIVKTT